jgi:hypothetical protein
MKEDYKIKVETKPLTVNIEVDVVETLKKMSAYTKFTEAEIVNTAIKRFIAVHSDFLPKKSN